MEDTTTSRGYVTAIQRDLVIGWHGFRPSGAGRKATRVPLPSPRQ